MKYLKEEREKTNTIHVKNAGDLVEGFKQSLVNSQDKTVQMALKSAPKKINVKCVSCHRDIEITEPEKGHSKIFYCPYCTSTNTFEHYENKKSGFWDDWDD